MVTSSSLAEPDLVLEAACLSFMPVSAFVRSVQVYRVRRTKIRHLPYSFRQSLETFVEKLMSSRLHLCKGGATFSCQPRKVAGQRQPEPLGLCLECFSTLRKAFRPSIHWCRRSWTHPRSWTLKQYDFSLVLLVKKVVMPWRAMCNTVELVGFPVEEHPQEGYLPFETSAESCCYPVTARAVL